MEDIDNPYRSPGDAEVTPVSADNDESEDPRKIGKARRVPTVGILMIIHGISMFVAACCWIGMLFVMVPQIAEQVAAQQELQRQKNPNAPQLSKETMTTFLYATYGGMSAILFIIGIIGVVAGIQNSDYRNRVFGIVSLVLNMGSILFCWCLPFSLGLLIFGLVIYLSPEADRAFTWRANNPSSHGVN